MRKTFSEKAEVKINRSTKNVDDFKAWLILKSYRNLETDILD